jgi:hypothetical protein
VVYSAAAAPLFARRGAERSTHCHCHYPAPGGPSETEGLGAPRRGARCWCNRQLRRWFKNETGLFALPSPFLLQFLGVHLHLPPPWSPLNQARGIGRGAQLGGSPFPPASAAQDSIPSRPLLASRSPLRKVFVVCCVVHVSRAPSGWKTSLSFLSSILWCPPPPSPFHLLIESGRGARKAQQPE